MAGIKVREGYASGGIDSGLGFFMGAENAMFTYGAIDAANHLPEELLSPSKKVKNYGGAGRQCSGAADS